MKTTYTYDNRGRVLSCSRNVDGVQKAAVSYSYDDLGRLSSKSLGNNCTESLSYDVHGWATQIQAKFGSTELFRENLRYNAPTKNSSTRARYDGLISEISSVHNGQTAQLYSYAYDGMKRLTDADHYIGTSTSTTLKDTEKGISYDRNGNISSMTRYGSSSTANTLSFTLTGNRVTGLSGSASSTFAYDASGNRTSDSRKGLTMSYNILNLPKLTTKSGSSLTYVYLSDGTKVSAQQSGGAGLKYRGAFVYDVTSSGTETLNSVAWDEGRLDYSASQTSPKDEWFVQDHLGNVRSVVNLSATTASAAVLEQDDYLPFGTRASTPTLNTSNRYRYAGKENQKVGSVDLALLDFGARLYDPYVCSWTSVDPMAEKYLSSSPFAYCGNSPMVLVDPDGRIWANPKEALNLTRAVNKQIKRQNKIEERLQSKEQLSEQQSNRLSETQMKIKLLNNSISDIKKLGDDQEHIYSFSNVDPEEPHYVTTQDEINVSIETSSYALSLHEIAHIRQSLDIGGLRFVNGRLANLVVQCLEVKLRNIKLFLIMKLKHTKSSILWMVLSLAT